MILNLKKMRHRQYQYKGNDFNKAWDTFLTFGKVYMDQRSFGDMEADFIEIKCDDGDMKYVPKELFLDVTEKVNEKFYWYMSRLLFMVLFVASISGVILGVIKNPKFIIITFACMFIYLLILNRDKE